VLELGLAWLRTELEDYIETLRSSAPHRSSASGSLSDLEADWLLRSLTVASPRETSDAARAARAGYESARLTLQDAGEPAQIDRLSSMFSLTPFDEDCLLLALAPRLDAAFCALLGYAHDRMQISSATVHLALALFTRGDRKAARQAYARLSPEASLRRFALVVLEGTNPSILSPIEIDERITRYLMGEDYIDPRIRSVLSPVLPGACPDKHGAAAEKLTAQLRLLDRPTAMIVGPRQSGRRAVAQTIASRLGLRLMELNVNSLPDQLIARKSHLALLAREATIGALALVIDFSPTGRAGSEHNEQQIRDLANEILRTFDGCLFIVAEERPALPTPVPYLRLSALVPHDRLSLWRRALGPARPGLRIDDERVAEHFQLGPSEIASIAAQNAEEPAADLWAACRDAARQRLHDLAERIEPRFGWDDIVLPENVIHDLTAIVAQVRYRAQVYSRGGFGKKLIRGRGVTALFAGPSGVGKTMAAEVIAGELCLDLCRIDLSGVVSKYIGETERNLKRVFDAAEASGAILCFDEADALFGKRSEVRDSHDRYANIEISYLLQRMEAYTGLAILATNLKGHLDPAFFRRLRYVIDIPFPDAKLRRLIWERAFPSETPVRNLDFDALARLEIPGGNIVVIAVNAAFLAAADGLPVDMTHVARAARAEFRKLDKELRLPWTDGR
jgi:hypothetical protein